MSMFIRAFILFFIMCTVFAEAQEITLDEDFSSMFNWFRGAGIWKIQEQKLFQTNAAETMAIASGRAVQKGYLVYSFELTITNGLEDGYGGAGIHILSDTPAAGRSWGQGRSVLLWLTYDVNAYGGTSFFGQIYHSTDAVTMSMIHDGNKYPLSFAAAGDKFPKDITGKKMTLRIAIDTATGNGILYDPFRQDRLYGFNIGIKNLTGDYISFRTNSLGVTIDNVRITNLPE